MAPRPTVGISLALLLKILGHQPPVKEGAGAVGPPDKAPLNLACLSVEREERHEMNFLIPLYFHLLQQERRGVCLGKGNTRANLFFTHPFIWASVHAKISQDSE